MLSGVLTPGFQTPSRTRSSPRGGKPCTYHGPGNPGLSSSAPFTSPDQNHTRPSQAKQMKRMCTFKICYPKAGSGLLIHPSPLLGQTSSPLPPRLHSTPKSRGRRASIPRDAGAQRAACQGSGVCRGRQGVFSLSRQLAGRHSALRDFTKPACPQGCCVTGDGDVGRPRTLPRTPTCGWRREAGISGAAAAVRRTFRAQGVARAGGGRNVRKAQGPRGQDARKAEQQRKQFVRGGARSCGQ